MATPRKKATSNKSTDKPAKAKITKAKKQELVTPQSVNEPFVQPVVMQSRLDLFADDDPSEELVEAMREGLGGVVSRAKTKSVSFLSPAQMVKTIIPIDEFMIQNALGAVGLRAATLFELIAPEHVGKTTLMANWMGKFALQGCQCLYVECEGKQMDPNRFLRCMHSDRKIAKRVFNLVTFSKARTLPEAEHAMNVWVKEARKKSDSDPRFAGKPLIVVVDPWGKLMSEGEAEGYSTFGKSKEQLAQVKAKETGKSSNLGHSKYAHAWTRRLPSWLESNNVLLIVVQHQNEHIDMGSYSTVVVPDSKNDTTIGGKAFAQLAAYRATLTSAGQWYGTNKVTIGLKTRLMFIKNSYGPKYRSADLQLKFEQHVDTDTHFDRVIHYAQGLADWMVANGILGTRVTDKLYTCETLDCVAVSADALESALKRRPDVMQFIGGHLKIEGYANVPMRTAPIEDDTPDDKTSDESAYQDIPEEVRQALAASEHLNRASDVPPPPPTIFATESGIGSIKSFEDKSEEAR